jgi:hypothetical protein
MRPGPRKTPTALDLARGHPSRRPIPLDEPKPALADGTPPAELEGAALVIWLAVAPGLVACSLLAEIDVRHVARACRYEALADALWRVAAVAPIGETRLGDRRQAQELSSALALYEAADRIWYRVGITPSERTHLRGHGPSEPKDRLDAHLRQRPQAPHAVTA